MNRVALVISLLMVIALARGANAPSIGSATATSPTATTTKQSAAPTVIVVVGAEGAPEYGRAFSTWSDRWRDAAARGSANFILIGGDASTSMTDKQRLKKLLQTESTISNQPLWLVLIGHGTFNGNEAKFNLRDEDVSGRELAEWLKGFTRPLAVIACSSASAPLLRDLAGDGRVIITATRSGSEVQFSRFGDYLSAAISDPAADLDKDGQTSLLEAFLAASHRVEAFYKQDGRLATEHALLDDNGDKLGVSADWFQGIRATRAAQDGAPIDGPRAHQWHLVPSAEDVTMSPADRSRRDELELAIESLRGRKASMKSDEYYAQLEPMLIELARLYVKQPGTKPATTQPATRSRANAK